MTRVVMCPRISFGVEYEINPWMHRDEPPVLSARASNGAR